MREDTQSATHAVSLIFQFSARTIYENGLVDLFDPPFLTKALNKGDAYSGAEFLRVCTDSFSGLPFPFGSSVFHCRLHLNSLVPALNWWTYRVPDSFLSLLNTISVRFFSLWTRTRAHRDACPVRYFSAAVVAAEAVDHQDSTFVPGEVHPDVVPVSRVPLTRAVHRMRGIALPILWLLPFGVSMSRYLLTMVIARSIVDPCGVSLVFEEGQRSPAKLTIRRAGGCFD